MTRSLSSSLLVAALLLAGTGMASRAEAQMAERSATAMARTDGPKNPDTARRAFIDRFSPQAGTLQVRTSSNGLPGPNEPIDFDQGPFVTQGLGPDGTPVRYYNFDVQGTTPAPIYVLFREGEDAPVADQLNIVDVVPGDDGYNDFWQVVKVTVPRDYVANTVTSLAEIRQAEYATETTTALVNCPIVPAGSSATERLGGESEELQRGWYRGQVVHYFTFEERDLSTTSAGKVPVSPIYVVFATNPDQPGGGPPSGFAVESGSVQTHNVVQTLPTHAGYSPLWLVNVYDNADFAVVRDLRSALRANILARSVTLVNCPVVWIGEGQGG